VFCSVSKRNRHPIKLTREREWSTCVVWIDLRAVVDTDVEGFGQRIGADMHLWHLDLVDLLAINKKHADATERLSQFEIEFQVGFAFRQPLGCQVIVYAIKEVVVEMKFSAFNVHGVAAGHSAAGDDHTFFFSLKVNCSLDLVRTVLYRG